MHGNVSNQLLMERLWASRKEHAFIADQNFGMKGLLYDSLPAH